MGPVPALPVTQDYIKIAASTGPPQYQVQISSYGIRGTAWWSGLFPSHAKVTGEGSKTESPPELIFLFIFLVEISSRAPFVNRRGLAVRRSAGIGRRT